MKKILPILYSTILLTITSCNNNEKSDSYIYDSAAIADSIALYEQTAAAAAKAAEAAETARHTAAHNDSVTNDSISLAEFKHHLPDITKLANSAPQNIDSYLKERGYKGNFKFGKDDSSTASGIYTFTGRAGQSCRLRYQTNVTSREYNITVEGNPRALDQYYQAAMRLDDSIPSSPHGYKISRQGNTISCLINN